MGVELARAAPEERRGRKRKLALRFASSLGASAFFLWLTFRHVDFATMWRHIAEARHGYTVLFALSLVGCQVARVVRWDLLIKPFAKVSMGALFRIGCVGLMLILVLPLRLGELGRPYLLKRETGAPLSAGLGSIVVERVIDGLVVTLLFFATTLLLGGRYELPAALRVGGYAALAIFAGTGVVTMAALLTHGWVPQHLERWGRPIAPRLTDKVIGVLAAFVSGLRALPDVRAISAFIAWTLAYWVMNGLGMWAMMLGFGWDLPPHAGFLLVSVLVIGIMIPAGPGFLGTFQGAILAGLAVFGIDQTRAAAYSMVVYPITVAVTVGFGLPYLWGTRARVAEIVDAGQADEGAMVAGVDDVQAGNDPTTLRTM